jgi:hypothetical protein
MLAAHLHQRQIDALTPPQTHLEVFAVQESFRLYRYAQRHGSENGILYHRMATREAIRALRHKRAEFYAAFSSTLRTA